MSEIRNRTFSAYVKRVAFEFGVLVVLACALSSVIMSGFTAAASLDASGQVRLAVLVAVLLAALFGCAYSRRTLALGIPALIVVLIGACAAAVVLGGGANIFADEEGNTGLLVVVVVVVTVVCFAASRTKPGCILLGVGGCLAACLAELLFAEFHVASCVALVLAAPALFIYRSYVLNLAHSQTRKTSFATAGLGACVACLVSAGLAAALFICVIAPLNPAARDLVLVTKYLALEELPRLGVNEELAITNPDLSSVVVGDRIEYLEPDDDQDNEELADEEDEEEGATQSVIQIFASAIGYNLDSIQQIFKTITHETVWWGWVLIVLVFLCILGSPFFIKICLRRRFYRRALQLEPPAYVMSVYKRIEQDFEKMGLGRLASSTIYEYAKNRTPQAICFSQNEALANFSFVSHLFVKARYGQEPLRTSELVAFDAFWRGFYTNCRLYLGWTKYMRLFFKL